MKRIIFCAATSAFLAFNVNAETSSGFQIPINGSKNSSISVGVADDGSFIMAWVNAETGTVDGRCFSRDRAPLGEPLTLVPANSPESWESVRSNTLESPALAMSGTGAFVLAWNSAEGIKARKYDGCTASGIKEDHPLVALSSKKGYTISAAINNAGISVVTWEEFVVTAHHDTYDDYKATGSFARRLDANGVASKHAIVVSNKGEDWSRPSVALTSDKYLLAWSESSENIHRVLVQSYDFEDLAAGPAIEVSKFQTDFGGVFGSAIAANEQGEFSVIFGASGGYNANARTWRRWVEIYRYDSEGMLSLKAQSPKYKMPSTMLTHPLAVFLDGKGSETVFWSTNNRKVNNGVLWSAQLNNKGLRLRKSVSADVRYAKVASNSKGEFVISYYRRSKSKSDGGLLGWLGRAF
ncbi:hypothetical protein [Methylococcus mesophilus]|uniref:hypothetical protein n=1 Tax=Methylococcus mesophilus TaxID=2993564 RepID=UPI00224AE240|nr:hypothetical protein [Methylococcus mesophilus]UZR27139.1 hypothetical protein OOT43_10345 [Methylococcus mesophilus]